jgi:hypothetical protein
MFFLHVSHKSGSFSFRGNKDIYGAEFSLIRRAPKRGQFHLFSLYVYNIKRTGRIILNDYWVIIWKKAFVVSCNYYPRIRLQRHLSPWNIILLENLIIDLPLKFSSPFRVHKSMCKLNLCTPIKVKGSRDSSVGIATSYGLDDQGKKMWIYTSTPLYLFVA